MRLLRGKGKKERRGKWEEVTKDPEEQEARREGAEHHSRQNGLDHRCRFCLMSVYLQALCSYAI